MGLRSTKRRRVFVEDARRDGSYLRATWHPDRRVFVLSTWCDDLCTGAVRLPAGEAADLVGLLVDGLGDLAEAPHPPERGGRRTDLRSRLVRWLRGVGDRPATDRPLRTLTRTTERRRRSA